MSNKVEFVAGNGINITADNVNRKITIASTGGGTIPVPLPTNQGGTGRTDLTSEDFEKIKNLDSTVIKLITITNQPTLITASGTYIIPANGKYRIRLCGGGASGNIACKVTNGDADNHWGCGGNSGYLRTEELILQKNTVLNIVIGAGGLFDATTPVARNGGNTTIEINGTNYEALGGEANTNIRGRNASAPKNPSILYDGIQGSAIGGSGGLLQYNHNSYNYIILPTNGMTANGLGGLHGSGNPVDFISYTCGGGAGGVIKGNILAGRGYALTAAQGYGAGGGGGGAGAFDVLNYPIDGILPGNGASGAVEITYLGSN